jgi:hypothetical protein
VRLAVAVVFAVGSIALFVVADQIAPGKTVVGGGEVDAGAGVAAVGLIEIGAAGEAESEILCKPITTTCRNTPQLPESNSTTDRNARIIRLTNFAKSP